MYLSNCITSKYWRC